jgi:hypothetical protein
LVNTIKYFSLDSIVIRMIYTVIYFDFGRVMIPFMLWNLSTPLLLCFVNICWIHGNKWWTSYYRLELILCFCWFSEVNQAPFPNKYCYKWFKKYEEPKSLFCPFIWFPLLITFTVMLWNLSTPLLLCFVTQVTLLTWWNMLLDLLIWWQATMLLYSFYL